MFERIANGWALTAHSFRVLRMDKQLMVFPLFSGLACILVLASFLLPLWGSGNLDLLWNDHQLPTNPLAYVLLFAFYFVNYFVIVFFNAALISCAMIRFAGGAPTLGDGLRAAGARLPQIAGWALVSATVGFVLRIIESQSEKAGQFVAALLGMAWGVMTYFVVPVLVVEQVGPIEAVKRSTSLLRKSWGESATANITLGPIVFVAYLLAILPAVAGFAVGTTASLILGIGLTALLWIVISLASAAVHAILLAALYLYASEGTAAAEFDEQTLAGAFRRK